MNNSPFTIHYSLFILHFSLFTYYESSCCGYWYGDLFLYRYICRGGKRRLIWREIGDHLWSWAQGIRLSFCLDWLCACPPAQGRIGAAGANLHGRRERICLYGYRGSPLSGSYRPWLSQSSRSGYPLREWQCSRIGDPYQWQDTREGRYHPCRLWGGLPYNELYRNDEPLHPFWS